MRKGAATAATPNTVPRRPSDWPPARPRPNWPRPQGPVRDPSRQ